jgi:hypothetical protein
MSSRRQSRYVLLAVSVLLLCAAVIPARADSAYNISGYFYNKKGAELYFGGVLDWNAKTHQVTGYTLTLGNSTFSCNGSCNFVFKNFQGPGYTELLTGSFNPKDTDFTLRGWGKGYFEGKINDMAWTSWSQVPDAPAMAELFCVLAFLGLMIPRARLLRRTS